MNQNNPQAWVWIFFLVGIALVVIGALIEDNSYGPVGYTAAQFVMIAGATSVVIGAIKTLRCWYWRE